MKGKKLNIFIDGGSRGNPGRGACAAAFFDEKGGLVREESRYLGRCTNNFAEYNALILALSTARQLGVSELKIFSDSELLVKQFKGEYRIKDPTLQALMGDVKKELAHFNEVAVSHVRREANSHADRLVNEILDDPRAVVNLPGTEPKAQHPHQPKLF